MASGAKSNRRKGGSEEGKVAEYFESGKATKIDKNGWMQKKLS